MEYRTEINVLKSFKRLRQILTECEEMNFTPVEILHVLVGFETAFPRMAQLLREYDVYPEDRLRVERGVGPLCVLEADLLSAIGSAILAERGVLFATEPQRLPVS